MDNKQLTELKSIIDNYENLKEKVFRVVKLSNSQSTEIKVFSLNDNGNIEAYYEYYCHGYDTNSEWFPVELLEKSDEEICDYFRERREKEFKEAKRREKAAERRAKVNLRKKELAELKRLKKKYES